MYLTFRKLKYLDGAPMVDNFRHPQPVNNRMIKRVLRELKEESPAWSEIQSFQRNILVYDFVLFYLMYIQLTKKYCRHINRCIQILNKVKKQMERHFKRSSLLYILTFIQSLTSMNSKGPPSIFFFSNILFLPLSFSFLI